MAVEAVADIRSVGDIFNDAIFLTELLNLKTAKAFCRCSVDRIKISILFLVLIDLLIDILQYIQSKLSVFTDRFTVIELLKLI